MQEENSSQTSDEIDLEEIDNEVRAAEQLDNEDLDNPLHENIENTEQIEEKKDA